MHLVTMSEPVNLGKTLGVLAPGQWLMQDLNAFEVGRLAPRGTVKLESNWTGESQDGPSWCPGPGGPALIMRSGAIGDLLLLSPVLAQLKRQNGVATSVCCFSFQHELFRNNPDIHSLVNYPLAIKTLWDWSNITSLENTMELNHAEHPTDVFAKALGLTTPLADYRPVYHVTDQEKADTEKHLFKNRPNLAVQMFASVPNRDYPLTHWIEVIKKLEARGWGILLLGAKGQIPPLPPYVTSPFIRDLSAEGLSLRESAAVLSQCEAFVGIDSMWAHMCHALDIPAVVLFGPFDWKVRTSKAPKTIALSGTGECAPCNWHMHAGRPFPPNKPCTQRQQCVVLASIPPDRVVTKVSLLKPS